VGSEEAEFSETLVTLGVMQDAPMSISYPTKSLLNFTVEGLT
jgi:type III secretory pathway component EscR